MRQEDAGSERLFGNFLQLSAVHSRLRRRKSFAVRRRVALAGTMRVRSWRASNEPSSLCQIPRKQLCQIIRKVTFSPVNFEILLRDFLVDILRGRVKNFLMLRTILVSSDPMMLYALA
jgi:hypothetical protein